MSESSSPPGDRARASVLVRVEPELAWEVFTADIDRWWRRGLRYRVAGGRGSTIRLEPGVGGRLLESIDEGEVGPGLVQTGTVTIWDPPTRLVLEWRAVNFAPGEQTEVEVEFEPQPGGTLVTVTHRGWSRIRSDHPVRHGAEVTAFIRRMGMWWADLLTSLRERAEARVSDDGER